MIIGIDHGYYAIKTKQVCFPTGLMRYTYEPYTMQNVLQYGGAYYVCGTGRQTLVKDNEKKDTQEDAEQRATTDTMVMVKLENIADDLKDIKRESRENREEMKTLRERVVIVEQSLKSYHKRLDGEQHSDR